MSNNTNFLLNVLSGKAFEEGSPLSNLFHVLTQDGKYVPLNERPKVEEAPFGILSQQQGFNRLWQSPTRSFGIKDIVESLGVAILSGQVGFGDQSPQYAELIVDDRNLPRNIEADVVIALSADPIHVDTISCGVLIVHCPEFHAKDLVVDNYIAVATESLNADHLKALCGTILANNYAVRDAEVRNVRIVTNTLASDVAGDNSSIVNFSDLTVDEKSDIYEGLKAIGDATSVLVGSQLVDLTDAELDNLDELIRTIEGRDRDYRAPARARNRTANLNENFEMFGRSYRRNCRNQRQSLRGNGRPTRQTNGGTRIDRLESMMQQLINLAAQNNPNVTGQATAPQGTPQATPQQSRRRRMQPNQQTTGSSCNSSAVLTGEEVTVLESLPETVLDVILNPLTNMGLNLSNLNAAAKVEAAKLAANTNPQALIMVRTILTPYITAARTRAAQQAQTNAANAGPAQTGPQPNGNAGAGPIPSAPHVPGAGGAGARP